MMSLSYAAVGVLTAADPDAKARQTAMAAAAWRRGDWTLGHVAPPDRPARPARPELRSPGQMPKRSTGPKGRFALIHALAHIELNAVDLAWDIIARFGADMPRAFIDDWVGVADEEARHYALLAARLKAWDAAYGDLPAHDGLWEAAMLTADDLAARLVLVPLTLEARGIDVTPQTAAKFRHGGDAETADALDVIYTDEISHLAVGITWFEWLCARDGRDPHAAYREILDARFTGTLKGPFNLPARATAGMKADYLTPWL
jgi:uncharacterized ferritin-like protein (DUF455 family)